VTLAPSAQDNGLACMIAELLRENVAGKPSKRRDLRKLRGRVGVVARDAGVAMTLEFGGGRLIIHDGLLWGRALTITADSEQITQLSLVNVRFGVPLFHDEQGKPIVLALLLQKLRIDGLARHPRTLIRLTRLLSING
jgi:hypothetical protein